MHLFLDLFLTEVKKIEFKHSSQYDISLDLQRLYTYGKIGGPCNFSVA